MSQYEYVSIEVPTAAKGEQQDDVITAKLNEFAADGWRLNSVLPRGQVGGGHLIFEKENPDPTPHYLT